MMYHWEEGDAGPQQAVQIAIQSFQKLHCYLWEIMANRNRNREPTTTTPPHQLSDLVQELTFRWAQVAFILSSIIYFRFNLQQPDYKPKPPPSAV